MANSPIRAFVAIGVDQAVFQRLIPVVDELKQVIAGIRWVPPSNCHLTLKFLGGIEESQIGPLSDALERGVNPFPRFTINAKGLGVFPDAMRPRVLWVGFEGRPLSALAERVESATAAIGFEREERIFTPHLTIGRWRHLKRPDSHLRATLEKWKDHDFGVSHVAEVILFQSLLNRNGALYQRLKTIRLGDGSPVT